MKDTFLRIYNRSPRIIQTVGLNVVELKQRNLLNSHVFNDWLQFLKKTESWNIGDFTIYQNKHLKSILEHAFKYVPFYHKLYKKNKIDISKIKTINDLEKLPVIKKEDIQKNWASFISTKNEKFIIRHTSGTTGTPLTIRISCKLDVLERANWERRNLWAGYNGGWIARFVGDKPVSDCSSYPLYRKSYVMKRAIFPTYCLSVDTMHSIFENLKKLNIEYIQCYPSAGYLLAKYLEIKDKYFPLKAILYSSEPLYDFQRALMEERFDTRLFGYYGQAEEAVSAIECEQKNLHLTMINGILEIVKNNELVADGERGFTIVTSLHNYSMPLIRYELNDYTGYKTNRCTCPRTLPEIHQVETFHADFIITSRGKIIPPSVLTFPITSANNIIESQFIQKQIDSVIVKIVPSEKYNEINEHELVKSLKQILGDEINVKIQHVQKIYLSNAYKKRFVINEIGRNSLEKIFEKFN